MFLPHKIDTFRSTVSLTRWSQVETFSRVLAKEKAIVYRKPNQWSLGNTDLGNNTEIDNYKVITKPVDIQVWDQVNVYWSDMISKTGYIVDSIDVNYSLSGQDNMHFTITRQDD